MFIRNNSLTLLIKIKSKMTKQEKGTKDGVTLNFRIDLTLHSALIVGWTNYRNTTGDKMPMHDYIPKVLNAGIKAMKK